MQMDRISAAPRNSVQATTTAGRTKSGAAAGAPAFEALLGEAPAAAVHGPAQTATIAASIYDAAEQAVIADREARRHGRAMLHALAGLQRAALAGAGQPDTAEVPQAALAALMRQAPAAHDPVLRLILREIGVRAAVELARAPASAAFANVSVS